MRSYKLMVTGIGAVLLSACGLGITSGSHFTRELELNGGATFAWNQTADRVIGDPRLEGNPFFEQRLHEAVAWQLSMRGIHETDATPTFFIHHHLTLAEHAYVEEVMDDAGYPRTDVYAYEGGNVVVHIVEAATGETIWLGWARANIEPALAGPDQMRKWVYDVVAKMFEKWPIPQRAAG